MKRDVVAAVVYGLAWVAVGGVLILWEAPWHGAAPAEGKEAGPWERDRSMVEPANLGRGSELHGDGGVAVEAEVGPDGIRWVPVQAEGPPREAGVDPSAAPGMDLEGRMVGPGPGPVPRLPESGRELLQLGDPSIQAVADLLTEAGATEPILELALRGIYGHVQRLATFNMLARMDAESALEQEQEESMQGPTVRPGMPPLQWRVEVWRRRSEEYAAYVHRDLQSRLGIQDETVVHRLVGIADGLQDRRVGVPSSGDPAPP